MYVWRWAALALIAVLAGVGPVAAATVYVSLDGGHNEPFTNWSNAATNIQAAIGAASPDDLVLVSNGYYRLTNQIIINKAIVVSSLVGRAQTSLNGDYFDGKPVSNRCVMVQSGGVLDGFTISNGYAFGYMATDKKGGGVYIDSGLVRNCDIVLNKANTYGGGVYCLGQLADCLVSGNVTLASGSGFGGGVAAESGGAVSNCVILNNTSTLWGGGLWLQSATAQVCTVNGNQALTAGGGIYARNAALIAGCPAINSNQSATAGGIYLSESGPASRVADSLIGYNAATNNAADERYGGGGIFIAYTGMVERCAIIGNISQSGGGGIMTMHYSGYPAQMNGLASISNCVIYGNRAYGGVSQRQAGGVACSRVGVIANCMIGGNFSSNAGGGVSLYQGGLIRNSLVFSNAANVAGGIFLVYSGAVENCTVADNAATNRGGGIYLLNHAGYCENTISYFNTSWNYSATSNLYIDGGTRMFTNCCIGGIGTVSGTNNIESDPAFVNWAAGDYHLQKASLCVNAGVYRAWMQDYPRDADGYRRISDVIVDMGALEYQHAGTMLRVR